MKNCYSIENKLDAKFAKILNHDKNEIDNPIKNHYMRINYMNRLQTIISLIKRMFPTPTQVKVGDFACAQGNMSLSLAEEGYDVLAIDINPIFIEYSKMKYEFGNIEWICEDLNDLDSLTKMLDIAIVG